MRLQRENTLFFPKISRLLITQIGFVYDSENQLFKLQYMIMLMF
jgi:hypothetical protein